MAFTIYIYCLVPRPRYSARPKRFGSRGPSEIVRLKKNPQKWDKSETALISGGGLQLKTSVSHVKAKNTPLKDTEKGRESSKECLVFFQWTKEGFSLQNCPPRNSKFTKFSSQPIGALGLFWNATKQPSFWKVFRYILYSLVKKITSLKENLRICLSLVSIWSSGSYRSPQPFHKISRRSGRLGRLVVSMWSSRSNQSQDTGSSAMSLGETIEFLSAFRKKPNIKWLWFLFGETTSSLSICFFSWLCGVEKLEEFDENILWRRELDVTDFL